MASDDYHEALLARIQEMQQEILQLSHREAVSFAYLMSQDVPEEGARMLVAELLLDYWKRERRTRKAGSTLPSAHRLQT
jgi:hypothetical protein